MTRVRVMGTSVAQLHRYVTLSDLQKPCQVKLGIVGEKSRVTTREIELPATRHDDIEKSFLRSKGVFVLAPIKGNSPKSAHI